jgi:hypothetical protein
MPNNMTVVERPAPGSPVARVVGLGEDVRDHRRGPATEHHDQEPPVSALYVGTTIELPVEATDPRGRPVTPTAWAAWAAPEDFSASPVPAVSLQTGTVDGLQVAYFTPDRDGHWTVAIEVTAPLRATTEARYLVRPLVRRPPGA